MASACHRSARRGSLRVVALLLLGAPPSIGKRDHLVVEPDETSLSEGPNNSRSVSEIVGAATEQALAPLRQARAGLQARLQELDAKMAKLREEHDALQEEAQRQDERVRTLEEMKQRYGDLLDRARDGMKALERNYTSNTEEAGRILRCLDGGCGKVAGNGTEHDGETDVMNQQKELEAGLLGPAPDEAHPDEGVPDISAEQKDAIGQLDAQLKADAAAEEKEEGFVDKVKDFFEDHFIGDDDEKTIGEPVHEDGTPLAAGESAANATNATESVAEANGTEEGGSTSAEPAEANETEEGGSTSAEPAEAKATGGSSTSARPEEGGSTSAAPVEGVPDISAEQKEAIGQLDAQLKADAAAEAKEEGFVDKEGGSTSSAPVEGNETEESPYDHADDTHELDPSCQDAFMRLPAAIRQHSVGFAKGKGDCKDRAMVLETAPGSEEEEEGGSTSAEPAEAKATAESTSSTSAGALGEGGSTSAAPAEASATRETPDEVLNRSKPREAPVDARGRPVEVQRHDATESTVSAGSEEGSEEEEEEEDNATKEIAISARVEGGSSTSAAPRKASAAGKSTDPLDADDFSSEEEEEGNPGSTQTDLGKRHVPGLGGLVPPDVAAHRPGEERTASGFAPPSAESVADESDACTEVKYSWKSVRPSATVCLPEDAPMTALLAAVCSEQLGPAGYDISKCSAEPYVRCQGKSEQGKWYSVDQKMAAQATVGAVLQNDFAHGHFTCENRVKV